MADADLLQEEFQLRLTPIEALKPADAVVLSVAHRRYREGGWDLVKPLLKRAGGFVADVPALLDRSSTPTGITRWRL
jgi:UDP-N-acetyl-D-galactosamine dehydrogenase